MKQLDLKDFLRPEFQTLINLIVDKLDGMPTNQDVGHNKMFTNSDNETDQSSEEGT